MANADIFISYNRKDHELVAKLVHLFEWYGYSVWWDVESLRSGEDFAQVIQKAIDDVKCVVVIWSQDSVQSKWVRSEAQIAENSNKLLPVVVDVNAMKSIPAPSNLLHSEILEGWLGNPQDRCFQKVLEAVERFCPQSSKQAFVPKTVDSRPLLIPPVSNTSGKLGWFLAGLLVGGALGYGYFEMQKNVQWLGSEEKIHEQNAAETKQSEKDIIPGAGRFIDNVNRKSLNNDFFSIFNNSFEIGSSGWGGYSYERADYVTEVVNGSSRSGLNSFHIKSKADKPKQAYVMKDIDKKENLEAIKSRKIKISTYVKAKNISGRIIFYVNFFSEKEKKRWTLSTTNYIRESKSNWLEYSLRLRVPENTLFYSVYTQLNGKGEIWIDDFGVELLDAAAETQELKEFPYEV